MNLWRHIEPVAHGITIAEHGAEELAEHIEPGSAALVEADPPWMYEAPIGAADPSLAYKCLSIEVIRDHIAAAATIAAPGSRLALWTTWPKIGDIMASGQIGRWRYVTGGSWHKLGGIGVGYHWRGHSEPLLIYRLTGPTGRPREMIKNAHATPARLAHSEKPIEWLRQIVRAWTDPGDLVVSLYAGRAPLAEACAIEGRRFYGCEPDPARRAHAIDRVRSVLARRAEVADLPLFGGA